MTTKTLAQEIAEQSIVLLKNENNLLPFEKGRKIAVFGRAQIKSVFSGNGSGASGERGTAILNALENAVLQPVECLSAFYRKLAAEDVEKSIDWELLLKTGNSGLAYELFGQYRAPAAEYDVPNELLRKARSETDTALIVLGRNSGGEECDRQLNDDYNLTVSEHMMIESVCCAFPKAALVLNLNGIIDLGWLDEYPAIQSVLFLGIPGEDGAAALANILNGEVSPSGRLAFTIARHYKDYPSSSDFSCDKDAPLCYKDYGLNAEENGSIGFRKSPVTVYREGIFNGYRYFDAFGVKPLFPFGHGLSYTKFETEIKDFKKTPDGLKINAQIKNIGRFAGREAVPLYQRGPFKKLWGFEKTGLLNPGETQTLKFLLPWEELAVYHEDKALWSIEPGTVCVELQDGQQIGTVVIPTEIPLTLCESRLPLQTCNRGKISFLHCSALLTKPTENKNSILLIPTDVKQRSLREKTELTDKEVSFLSVRELAALCVGYGPGIPFSALSRETLPETIFESGKPLTVNNHPTGPNGYVSPAIPDKEIHSVCYKDGPAGIGGVAWPTEMLLGCSFDKALLARFGNAIGAECEELGVDIWLAPAVNLHRNPLCGRNFEYFSEDPLLTGSLAVAVAKGVQENHPVLVCPKHFAANEQESYRRGSAKRNYDAVDSVIEERTLRELYLKPFEMLIKQANIACIMTSFNKINGTFAAGSRDLCTHILREEWGFNGCVITDWGDMDIVVDGGNAVAAGNDVIMPGGPPVISQILKGYAENRVTLNDLKTAVKHLLEMLERTKK